jgi:hypothetical protein
MKTTTLLILFVICLMAGCNTKGEPVEFARVCDEANEKKVVEVSGFLVEKGGVFCSNIGGGRLECGFTLTEKLGDEKGLKAEIAQGTSANSVEQLPKGYKKEDIKIRDNGGSIIAPSDKVKITGKMSIGPAGVPCFMQVDKIER